MTQQTSDLPAKKIICAVAQMNTMSDIEDNILQAGRLIKQAVEQNAELVLLPEVFACYDSSKYLALANKECGELNQPQGKIRQQLSAWAKQYQINIIAGTLPAQVMDAEQHISSKKVYARCYVYNHLGDEVAAYDKIHLFDVDLDDQQKSYRESNLFQAGIEPVVVDLNIGRVGLSICYDLRFPQLFSKLRQMGAEILVVPSAFTFKTGQAHWQALLQTRAIEQQCFVLAANQCGWHDDKRQTYGHSMIVDAWGKVQNQLEHEVGIAVAELDFELLNQVRRDMPIIEHTKTL